MLGSNGLCGCDTSSIIISTGCLKCSLDPFSTGLVSNPTSCQCKARFSWDSSSLSCKCNLPFVLSNNVCGCPPLQILNPSGICACDPSISITISANECFSCKDLAFSTGAPNSTTLSSCGCLTNFIWESSTMSCKCFSPLVVSNGACGCPPPQTLNRAGVCVCDPTVSSGCLSCSSDPYSSGIISSDGSSCQCLTSFVWNPTTSKC